LVWVIEEGNAAKFEKCLITVLLVTCLIVLSLFDSREGDYFVLFQVRQTAPRGAQRQVSTVATFAPSSGKT
jgi:hypothetical protein